MPPNPTNDPVPPSLSEAIVEALAYSDVFDYPLTVEQIHRYLVRVPATSAQVEATLTDNPWLAERIERHGDLFSLRGRPTAVALRRERAAYAEMLWRPARLLAELVAHLPFVRMVAIIGSLTMDNVRSPKDDVDMFVVTEPGRVWLTRTLIIFLVRLAALFRLELCPNYILSSRRLAMPPDDIFTARELTQMIPLYGRHTFADLLSANCWLENYLPNAVLRDERLRDLGPVDRIVQRLAEWPLSGRLGDHLECVMQNRKVADLRRQAATADNREVVLDAEMCKGHMGGHAGKIRAEYARRRSKFLAPDAGDGYEPAAARTQP